MIRTEKTWLERDQIDGGTPEAEFNTKKVRWRRRGFDGEEEKERGWAGAYQGELGGVLENNDE